MKKYKVMLVSGGFDPVHKGHLEMIEKANEMAEEVWVILNNDHWLTQKKGKPFMDESERQYIMSRIKGVTKTIICNPRSGTDKSVCDGIYSAVNIYRRDYIDRTNDRFIGDKLPMAFGNGGDRGKGNVPEEDYCKSMGVDMVWNLGDKVQSSSWLIEKATNSAYSSSNG